MMLKLLLVACVFIFNVSVINAGCIDRNRYCSDWAKRGQCSSNPAYMRINCQRSCNICRSSVGGGRQSGRSGSCFDGNNNCRSWARVGYCRSNPYTRQTCKKSCGLCKVDPGTGTGTGTGKNCPNCKDDNRSCKYWAQIGECSKNPTYMHESCKKSCRKCRCTTIRTEEVFPSPPIPVTDGLPQPPIPTEIFPSPPIPKTDGPPPPVPKTNMPSPPIPDTGAPPPPNPKTDIPPPPIPDTGAPPPPNPKTDIPPPPIPDTGAPPPPNPKTDIPPPPIPDTGAPPPPNPKTDIPPPPVPDTGAPPPPNPKTDAPPNPKTNIPPPPNPKTDAPTPPNPKTDTGPKSGEPNTTVPKPTVPSSCKMSMPVGLAIRASFPDEAFKATSSESRLHNAAQARLNLVPSENTVGAWCAGKQDANQFIMVDLQEKKKITSILTQGRVSIIPKYVKSYNVEYSVDNKDWKPVLDDVNPSNPKLFQGNSDADNIKDSKLTTPILARYIRIKPQEWENMICLRLEFSYCVDKGLQ